jgi:hypothetical protein
VNADFNEVPTRVDIHSATKARAIHAYWRRVEFHIASWEADELTASWAAKATNFSDDFSDEPKTTEITP